MLEIVCTKKNNVYKSGACLSYLSRGNKSGAWLSLYPHPLRKKESTRKTTLKGTHMQHTAVADPEEKLKSKIKPSILCQWCVARHRFAPAYQSPIMVGFHGSWNHHSWCHWHTTTFLDAQITLILFATSTATSNCPHYGHMHLVSIFQPSITTRIAKK